MGFRKAIQPNQNHEDRITGHSGPLCIEGPVVAIDTLGEGFINDTFIVRTGGDAPDYILQRKNKAVFPDIPAMMENIRKVTEHIRRRVAAEGGDPKREAMTVVPTLDGRLCHLDPQGEYWAVTVFIDDTVTYNKADSPEPGPQRRRRDRPFFNPSSRTSPNRWPRRFRVSTTSATASRSGTRRSPATPQAAKRTSRPKSAGSRRAATRCSPSGRRSNRA